ncbi:hypothetical protein CBM2589_A90798 [Cupriavidus taiwanensis]|uniref:Uncharacterized protein n=1 Tax=Cupriavidus taiwanensis TaxID=164546 RepID=A0A375CGE7_9BURK|nr:hypothetical protein CBM2589_A90798 [Cupriavidus taiwanensis]
MFFILDNLKGNWGLRHTMETVLAARGRVLLLEAPIPSSRGRFGGMIAFNIAYLILTEPYRVHRRTTRHRHSRPDRPGNPQAHQPRTVAARAAATAIRSGRPLRHQPRPRTRGAEAAGGRKHHRTRS